MVVGLKGSVVGLSPTWPPPGYATTRDLIGYIHENNFTLFDLSINTIQSDDNSHYNYQFKISLYRSANSSFILIVTTAQELERGDFSITVQGASSVSIRHQIENIDNIEPIIQSNYSSKLNNKSQKHTSFTCRPLDHYYEALEINVNTSGFYMFSSKSSLSTSGYFKIKMNFQQELFNHYIHQHRLELILNVILNILYLQIIILSPYKSM